MSMAHWDYYGSRKTMDQLVRIVNKEAAAEIRRLRKYIRDAGKEGRSFIGPCMSIDLTNEHALYDFLMAL